MSNESSASSFDRDVRYPPSPSPIAIRLDVPYSSDPADGRLIDMYSPVDRAERRPAIIIGSGYPAAGLRQHFGRSSRKFTATISWAKLLAAQGMSTIVYDAVDPAADLERLIRFLRSEGGSLGIDARRLGVFASSGNVPAALAAIATCDVQCAVLLYGFMLDEPGETSVAAASRQFGFANPNAGLVIDALPRTTHLLLVRAGRDAFAGLNAAFDRFVAGALRSNLPITVINHANAAHGFDLSDDSRETQQVIRCVLAFVRERFAE
jgi:hypothetical protein